MINDGVNFHKKVSEKIGQRKVVAALHIGPCFTTDRVVRMAKYDKLIQLNGILFMVDLIDQQLFSFVVMK